MNSSDIENEDGEEEESVHYLALEALKEIMAVRSNIVFPVLLPTLMTTPMTIFNANALSSIFTVARHALTKKLDYILSHLLNALNQTDEAVGSIKKSLKSLVEHVEGVNGVHHLLMTLIEYVNRDDDESWSEKCNAMYAFKLFCEGTTEDMDDYYEDWLTVLVSNFADENESIVKSAWSALDSLIKKIGKENLDRYLLL